MRDLWRFCISNPFSHLNGPAVSMTGISFTVLFASLQFCSLRCRSRATARIYCPPVLLHSPDQPCVPILFAANTYFKAHAVLIFPPFPWYLHFILCSPFSLFYLLFFTNVPEKAKMDSAPWLPSSGWQRLCNYFLIHTLSQCWTTLASLLGKARQVLQPKWKFMEINPVWTNW